MNAWSRTRDEWLALRCQAYAEGAFEDLIAEVEGPLFYYAAKLTGSREAALDAVQEVWIRALRGIYKLRDPASVRSWLYAMVRGIVVDGFRKERSRELAETAHAELQEEAGAIRFSAEDAAAVHQLLDRLETRHRDVLLLHFIEDFSLGEIARILGCPEGTVKSRVHYAKQALRAAMNGETDATRR